MMGTFEMGEAVQPAKIKVVGVGGCGQNAVDTMIGGNLEGVEFITVNTDVQALSASRALTRLQIGAKLTKGLGTGGDPEIGKNAALEDKQRIREVLDGADMIFVTAGLGGGTGTGASPVVAQQARETGALTVGVVTKPFLFEGDWRMSQAEDGLRDLKGVVDTVITIPNQRLLAICDKVTSFSDAFRMVDEILLQAVKGISDIVTRMGRQNRDFADVRTIMSITGLALMGSGLASGENRAVEATRKAISSPLLEDVSINGARGVLYNITAGPDLTLYEVNEIGTLIRESVDSEAKIIFGRVHDENLGDRIRVTVIATGFGRGAGETRSVPAAPALQPQRPAPATLQPPRRVAQVVHASGSFADEVRLVHPPSHRTTREGAGNGDREATAPPRRGGSLQASMREREREAARRSDPRERGGREGGFRSFFRSHLGGGSSATPERGRRPPVLHAGAENGEGSGGSPACFTSDELDRLNGIEPGDYDVPAFLRRQGWIEGNGGSEEEE